MDTQVADPLVGSLIDGRYRIRGRVARGGMATVYTADDERLGRTVALKILHPGQSDTGQPAYLDRFSAEAKTIARLTHPNVVAVYDQGTYRGLPYLVMEYVGGRTLRDILTERRHLNPAEALAIAEQMLAAIAAAHRAGLVHRDVKPENVLVAHPPSGGSGNLIDSVVKVADFGLAQAVSGGTDGGSQMMATVAYVAPELVAAGHADARTDVYSAGIVLFEMLTGQVPYDGDQPAEVAWRHVDNDVPPPSTLVPGLPAALDDLVVRATRRDPAARPTDAGALMSEVQTVRDDLGNANANTTLLRQVAQPTMALAQPTMAVSQPTTMMASAPTHHDNRPSWARLPEHPSSHRRGAEFGTPKRGSALSRFAEDQRFALVAALVALGLVALAAGWWFGFGRYTEAPQLVNLPKAEAQARAARAGFTVEWGTPAYDEKVARDSVLRQEPAAGERVVEGGTITVILSLGPSHYQVPDLVGQIYELAEAELKKLNLKVKRAPDRYSDTYPEGTVISVSPAAGETVQPGDTVTVTVSKGRAPITVPNLIGKNINEARAILQQLGLVPRETYKESDKPKDTVIGQSPPDGSGVEKGAEIKIDISQGPPLIVVPRVVDMPCPQAKQTLEGVGLRVRILNNPNGVARLQNPGENAQVPPGTEVTIVCA